MLWIFIFSGDTNLAVFRVIKAEIESVTKAEVSESEPTSEPQAVSSKTMSWDWDWKLQILSKMVVVLEFLNKAIQM